MRRVRYAVVSSLDGYIAGPNGEADWIVMDPDKDFAEIFKPFDTILVGRRTFEVMVRAGRPTMPGMKTFVYSRSLRQEDHPEVNVVSDDPAQQLTALKQQPGKDLWLFGGGTLFRSLLQLGLVDTVEVSIVPILLGAGIPLLPSPAGQAKLKLTSHTASRNGIVSLEYAVK